MVTQQKLETLSYNPKYEKIVIGTMLRYDDIRKTLTRQLSERDFRIPRHKSIFSALVSLVDNRLAYTPHTLLAMLGDEDIGGIEYLEELYQQGSETNIDHSVDRLRWDIARVDCFEKDVPELLEAFKDPRSTPEEANRVVTSIRDRITAASSTKHICSGSEAANQYMATLYARQIDPTFRSTGYKILDQHMTYGFARGKMTMLVASSSIGKTTLAANMARRLSRFFKVGYVCWESPKEDIIDIMVASTLKIPLIKLVKQTAGLTEEELNKIEECTKAILSNDNLGFIGQPPTEIMKGQPWVINDRVLDWLEGELTQWQGDITFVDLLAKRLPDSHPDKETMALNRLQEMVSVKRLNTHLVNLHQLKMKDLDARKDSRPTRDSLKGSSSWFDVPDNIFGLYRPAIYTKSIKDTIIEISCLKQRGGQANWAATMKWEGEFCRISGGKIRQTVYREDPDDYRSQI